MKTLLLSPKLASGWQPNAMLPIGLGYLKACLVKEGFKLVDKQGNEYDVVSGKGAFNKKKPLIKNEESGVVAISFKIQSGMEPALLRFTSNAGVSEKFLP